MAAAVYQGQLKFEFLRDAFRKELLSGADGKVPSPQDCAGSRGTGEQARERSDKRCFEVSSSQDGCPLSSFLASFGVVRPDDVSSSAPSSTNDVSTGRLQTVHGTPEAFWAFSGAAPKRKRVRGALFRQLSREETAALFDVGFENEQDSDFCAVMDVGCSRCVEGKICQGHAELRAWPRMWRRLLGKGLSLCLRYWKIPRREKTGCNWGNASK